MPSPIPPPPAVTQGTADDAKHVLAQRFKLPADYIAERLFDRQGCCVMGNMCVDAQGTLYWLINPEFRIYQVEPDGTMKLFAQDLPIDPGAVAFLTLIAYRGRARVVSKVGGTAQYAEPSAWSLVYHNGSNPPRWALGDSSRTSI